MLVGRLGSRGHSGCWKDMMLGGAAVAAGLEYVAVILQGRRRLGDLMSVGTGGRWDSRRPTLVY